MDLTRPYLGRFAPTPSGPLHFGSMVAAVGSYLDARSHGGAWQVRIDDLDLPRVAAGATEAILGCLHAFGMRWNGDVMFQSRRTQAYHAALHRLRNRGLVYPCACSRREIDEVAPDGVEGPVYPGSCRAGMAANRQARVQRLQTRDTQIHFLDRLQGAVRQDLAREIGDFVLYRADGVFAYHLACAVDDAEQGITHVVRGADLIASTPRQIYLQTLLSLPTPSYLHLPLATDAGGQKLSKQTHAPAVNPLDAVRTLRRVLDFLAHAPPAGLQTLEALWHWAISSWRLDRIPKTPRATD